MTPFVEAIPSEIPQIEKYPSTNFLELTNAWELCFIIDFFQQISSTNYCVFCLEGAAFPLFEESTTLQQLNQD